MRQTPALLWPLLCLTLALPAAASAEAPYVADSGSSSISGFSIGGEGLLSPIECAEKALCETAAGKATLTISPNGRYLFVANRAAATVSTFAIGAGGVLSPAECGKHCNTGKEPVGLAASPDGKYLYVASSGAESIATFSVGPGGSLTKDGCNPNTECETPEGRPVGLAVSPDGQFLYATTGLTSHTKAVPGIVSVFSIGGSGELKPVPCPGCGTELEPTGVTISPGGEYLYVANRGSDTVSAFSVGPKGELSPITCAESTCTTGIRPEGATLSPNGKYLYVSNTGSESISSFAVGAGGALSPASCALNACTTAAEPTGIVVSPGNDFLYAADSGAATISPFSVRLEGALESIACPTECNAGPAANLQSLAITPDQAPTASFTDALAGAFSESTFNAAASASAGQTISRYEWNFGDGSAIVTSSAPEVHHVFLKAQAYTVTLTVTDSAGCSTQVIFTGQTASCNGSSNAQHSASVTVPTFSTSISTGGGSAAKSKFNFSLFGKGSISPTRVKLTLSNLRQAAAKWREGKALAHISSAKKRPPIGTRFSFDLSQVARVTFSFFQSLPGRRVAKRCVAPSRRNAHARRCLRSVLAGTLKLAAGAGLDTLRFDGLLSRHKRLSPGSYTLVLSATSATGVHATTTALHFTIAKPGA